MKNLINWRKPTSSLLNQRNGNLFSSLQKEINKAFNNFYDVFETQPFCPIHAGNLIINPSMDIIEDDQNFKVELEMPGIDEKDVKVTVDNQTLSIQGKKEISKKDEGKNYTYREINYGHYETHVPLPDYVDPNEAKASFKKGMLWVTLPKKTGSGEQHREIKIEKITS